MVITPGIRNSYFMQALIIVSSTFHPVFRYSCFILLHSKILLLAAAATTKTCISLLSNCLCVKQNILQELFNHFFFYKDHLQSILENSYIEKYLEKVCKFYTKPLQKHLYPGSLRQVQSSPRSRLQQELPEQIFPPQTN